MLYGGSLLAPDIFLRCTNILPKNKVVRPIRADSSFTVSDVCSVDSKKLFPVPLEPNVILLLNVMWHAVKIVLLWVSFSLF